MGATIPATADEWGAVGYRNYQWLLDNYPDVVDLKTYTPFILTISKAGYETVKKVIDPVQADWFPAGINLSIPLKKSRDIYLSTDGDAFINTDPKNLGEEVRLVKI